MPKNSEEISEVLVVHVVVWLTSGATSTLAALFGTTPERRRYDTRDGPKGSQRRSQGKANATLGGPISAVLRKTIRHTYRQIYIYI